MAIQQSSAHQKDSTTIEVLCKKLEDWPQDMQNFSLSMRSLYADKELVSQSQDAESFNKFRDEIRKRAMFYMKVLNPLNIAAVRCVKDFMSAYTFLNFETWDKNLDKILSDVDNYRKLCYFIEEEHEKLIVPLKKVEDDVNILLRKLDVLKREVEGMRNRIVSALTQQYHLTATLAVHDPRTLLVSLPIAALSFAIGAAHVKGLSYECESHDAVISTVSTIMVQALGKFIKSVETLAAFFNLLHEELASLKSSGSMYDKNIHYQLMKGQADVISSLCRGFSVISPKVKTDLRAICARSDGLDFNHLFEKEQECIRENLRDNLGEFVERLSLE